MAAKQAGMQAFVRIPGVDGIFAGPCDLSIALGLDAELLIQSCRAWVAQCREEA